MGLRKDITIILFTLDETSYSKLAPMAGVYPALKLGPPWWFFDSYEGMKRFESTTETCGFYNTVGFNDDTSFAQYLLVMTLHAEWIVLTWQN